MLLTPCPRCGRKALNEPHKKKTRWYSFCSSCKKNSGVKMYWNEEKQKNEFEIYKLGRTGNGLVLRPSTFVDAEFRNMPAEDFRACLRAGKKYLDKKMNF